MDSSVVNRATFATAHAQSALTILTALMDRLFPIRQEIDRQEYSADLDERILAIADNLKIASGQCDKLTR